MRNYKKDTAVIDRVKPLSTQNNLQLVRCMLDAWVGSIDGVNGSYNLHATLISLSKDRHGIRLPQDQWQSRGKRIKGVAMPFLTLFFLSPDVGDDVLPFPPSFASLRCLAGVSKTQLLQPGHISLFWHETQIIVHFRHRYFIHQPYLYISFLLFARYNFFS